MNKLMKLAITAGIVAAAACVEEMIKEFDTSKEIQIGDLVQWESDGQLRFKSPKTVKRIEDSEFGKYAFFNDSSTGVPVFQLVKV